MVSTRYQGELLGLSGTLKIVILDVVVENMQNHPELNGFFGWVIITPRSVGGVNYRTIYILTIYAHEWVINSGRHNTL